MNTNKLGSIESMIMKKFFAPKLKQKTNFFRLLALAQRSGLWLRDALISIKKSETNQGLLIIIQSLIDQLTEWETLSEAMRMHSYFFKEEEMALIKSAEIMGNLPEVLDEIATELENSEKMNQTIKKAMTYPVILLVFAIVAIVILLVYVMPSIVSMFPDLESLPELTRIMMMISAFLQKMRYVLVIVITWLIIAIRVSYEYFLPFKMLIDKMLLILPTISKVMKTYYMYRFTKILGQLYNAWVNPILSLELMGNTFGNFFYKKKVMEIRENLNAWFTFGESMEGSTLFDPILVQIIHVGEDTWNITEVLKKMANFYSDMLKTKIDILMDLIQPLMLAFIAVIIGLIVASIFLPMAAMISVIQ